MHEAKECQRCGNGGELRPVDGVWLCKECMNREIAEYTARLKKERESGTH